MKNCPQGGTLQIENTCTANAIYQINLEVLNDTTLDDDNYIKIILDDLVPTVLTSNDKVEKALDNAKKSYKIKKLHQKLHHLLPII